MNKRIKWLLGSVFFGICCVALTVVALLGAVMICSVRLLRPETLTPIVCRVADKMLDAKLDVSRIELGFKPSFPHLAIEIDSLALLSHSLNSLPDSSRMRLPAYADTLLTFDRMTASVNVAKYLAKGEIALRDVAIVRPGVNIVIAGDSINNFDIYKSAPDTVPSEASAPMAAISINHFAFIEPREVRFFNALDSVSAAVLLFSNAELDGSSEPMYSLKINGELNGPMAQNLLRLDGFTFGVNGGVRWDPSEPALVSLERLNLRGAFINADVDAEVSFSDMMTVNKGRIDVKELSVMDALAALPSELLDSYGIGAATFDTDAVLSLSAELQRPFCFETDTLPYAQAELKIADCNIRYGNARFTDFGVDVQAVLRGNNLDDATATLRRLSIAGPATKLLVSGEATDFASDVSFDAKVQGYCDLKNLPPIVADLAGGYLSGTVEADLSGAGTMSMLNANRFHNLAVEGKLRGRRLYYLSNDTAKMAEVGQVDFDFDSRRVIRTDSTTSAPLMSATISADSASVLVDGVSIDIKTLRLGAAAQNMAIDTTVVLPMGGALKIGRMRVMSISDSAGMRLRNLDGLLTLNRFKGDGKMPVLTLDATAGRMMAGNPANVFMLSDAKIHVATHKIPERAAMRKAARQSIDSIRRVHPDLSPDSVYALALAKRRHSGSRQRRVHGAFVDDAEVIEWGITRGLRTFLTDWSLDGTVQTRDARLFTPFFPLRNRISSLNLHFTTDSVVLRGVRWQAGRSDMKIAGNITNIQRALTSRNRRSSLKVNFSVKSDTVDVNELTVAAFAGAAYAEKLRQGTVGKIDLASLDGDLDNQVDALVSQTPDSAGPLLVPTNIDANINVAAENILYSDLHLHDLRGDILMFDGGLNLNNLRAESDAGSLSLSALYSAPAPRDMKLGFGLMLDDFKIDKFLNLVPAIDSIMPLMRDISGIIDADLAATVDVDSNMNMVLPTLDAAVKLQGDSLAFINAETYRTLGKWLRFRDRADNKIKHMSVELLVRDNRMDIFPFTFDIDRYKLGVMGYNDLALNFDYHIAVLKSPLPFKFGINIKGNPDKYKVRFGGAKFREGMVSQSVAVVDTARVNLVRQIQNVFRRGVRNSRFARLAPGRRPAYVSAADGSDTLSRADSLALIGEGILPPPVKPINEAEEK